MKMRMIFTPHLTVRPFNLRDSGDYFELFSDEETTLSQCGRHAFTAMDEEFESLMNEFRTQDRYSIELSATGKVIGTISLTNDERAVPCSEIGFGISREFRGRGYGYEAVYELIRRGFENWGIEMYTACHYPGNEISANLLKKLGFRYEGIAHKAARHATLGITDLCCYYLDIDDFDFDAGCVFTLGE